MARRTGVTVVLVEQAGGSRSVVSGPAVVALRTEPGGGGSRVPVVHGRDRAVGAVTPPPGGRDLLYLLTRLRWRHMGIRIFKRSGLTKK